MPATLHIFPFSTYCEKAVWTLQHAQVPFDVRWHYPGTHMRALRKLSGATEVPVLETKSDVIAGSDKIAAHAHQATPTAGLIPEGCREEVLDWQRAFDDIGGMLRGLLFRDMLRNARLSTNVLTAGVQEGRLTRYGLMFRMMCPVLRRMIERSEPAQDEAMAKANSVFQRAAKQASHTGYLAGQTFTLADLTAASLTYPLFFPEAALGSAYASRQPELQTWKAQWADSPLAPYVMRIYSDHRGDPALPIAA